MADWQQLVRFADHHQSRLYIIVSSWSAIRLAGNRLVGDWPAVPFPSDEHYRILPTCDRSASEGSSRTKQSVWKLRRSIRPRCGYHGPICVLNSPRSIDLNDLEKLCQLQCTDEEIAAWFDASTWTIERRRLGTAQDANR